MLSLFEIQNIEVFVTRNLYDYAIVGDPQDEARSISGVCIRKFN